MFQLRANYEYCITKSEAGCIVNQSLNNLYTTPIVIELCDDIGLCESSTELSTMNNLSYTPCVLHDDVKTWKRIHRWIPQQRVRNVELWYSLCC